MDGISRATEENIKVIIRIKPNYDTRKFLTTNQESNTILVSDQSEYAFDKVASEHVSQEDLFDSCKNLFHSFVDGYNATIFAYGQTGSGKTFTMMGDSDETGIPLNPGLIPRGLEYVFDMVKERALSKNVEYLIKCSFVEIYNEQIYDLMDPQQQRLNLRFNISQEVYLEQCTEIIMENPKVAEEILRRGLKNRHMASTEMNRESSRSHAVFSIILESRESKGDIFSINKSCLHLVDLAGSERQKDSKTDGMRLKEAGMINKSLLALSMVIRKLVESAKSNKPTYIAYRDSKLTLLLKDSIGGNSKTSLVACVHNDRNFMGETLSTLLFASSVKMIRNKAKINMDTQGDNESLRNEIRLLRDQLDNNRTPQTIQEHEFDFDLVWKKRFIMAMALRSCMSLDVSSLNNQLTRYNTIIIRLDNTVNDLKTNLDIKDKKLQMLMGRIEGKLVENDDLEQLLETTVARLNAQVQEAAERIKCDQQAIEIEYLTTQLSTSKIHNNLAVSDQTLTHSLLKEYNSIVESGDLKITVDKLAGKDVELINTQQELAQCRYKRSLMKKKMLSLTTSHRDERRKLEAEIASMKSNVKVADEQREAAVVDRRKTLLSVHDIQTHKFSPITNVVTSRRGGQRKMRPSTLLEENEENEFKPLVDWIKNNDENVSKLDKIVVLEDAVRTKEMKIGKMEYDLKEYKNEIEELRSALFKRESVQKNLTDMEEKYNSVNMALQESHDAIKRVQKEYSCLEATKDKTIKLLTEKTFVLEEEMKSLESDKDMYKDELEQEKLTRVCLTTDMERKGQLVEQVEQEKRQIEMVVESLKSQITDNISVFEELGRKKYELATLQDEFRRVEELARETSSTNESLQLIVDECKTQEQRWSVAMCALNEKMEVMTRRNDVLTSENEDCNEQISSLIQERHDKVIAHDHLVQQLKTGHADKMSDVRSQLEKKESTIVSLNDELDGLRSQFEELGREKAALQSRLSCVSPAAASRKLLASPKTPASPLAKMFTKDSESRSSLLDDLMNSNIAMEQSLKQEREAYQVLRTIVEDLALSLQLPTSHCTVADMEVIRAKLVGYKLDLEELVIKKVDMEHRFKNLEVLYDSSVTNLEMAIEKRDYYRNQYEELCAFLPNGGHMNSKQKISYFAKYKEGYAAMRNENMELYTKVRSLTDFLVQKRLFDEFRNK